MSITCCGRECESCKNFRVDCGGCYDHRGHVPDSPEEGMCPIYRCAMERFPVRSCFRCPDLPCALFDVCIDSDLSPKQREQDKNERVLRLRNSTL